ncbi:(5-formylfuran-3-yl)methyl phosphate synthase [Aurantimonas coralicida]|uniref:(5-formylfuran-3-yl)methyl phosphate synthase n=1 Tax=Aurantimonas coralicida TaxID=182270 RepID=UPI001E5C40B5|nr:(5-formylfuran-3-yl)methyl phosphate synthase [Aurantimonas coralicida]MCD1643645.1 dihydroneopterin aldolase [Aurantimonas coralicida]
MIKLLASVTGPHEAGIVLEGGADLVDLKDPAKGALGAVSPQVLADTMDMVAGRRPVSAVAGDLPMLPDTVREAVEARIAADFVKIGLFPASRDARLAVIEGLRPLAKRTGLIAVFFADGDPDFSLLPVLAEAGFRGAMIDTIGKSNGRLMAHLSMPALGDFVRNARDLGLMSGLAGSLEPPDVPRLAVLRPDYLGFRGALTTGARDAPVDLAAVRTIRALLPATEEAAHAVEPVAGRGDRILVRDFTVPMEIGAYDHERGRTQKVRFSVEAEIAPIGADARSMADIYSYDLILDAIRALAARGHTDLVETLAVELAETVLADARIREVTVRVEKLELGPEAVGIELTRRRAGGR